MKKILPVIAIALGSCGPLFYAPNTTHTPLFSHAKELSASANFIEGCYELQAAGSVTDHILVLGSTAKAQPKDDNYDNGGSGSLFEGGAGYYSTITEKFAWGVNGLVGKGEMENHYPPSQGIKADMFRYSFVPYIGYMTERFEGVFATRLTGVNYSGISGSLISNNRDWVDYLQKDPKQFFIEPSLTLRFGYKYAFFQTQYIGSINITDPYFPDRSGVLSFGLHLKYSFKIEPKQKPAN